MKQVLENVLYIVGKNMRATIKTLIIYELVIF